MSQRASSIAVQKEAQRAASVRCWRCAAEQPPHPLCTSCHAVLPLPADADPYQVFDMPRRLALDPEEISRRYYELSRLLHPDQHTSGSAEARQASMQNTAALTRAYRILRDPVARGLDWLELHGEKLGDDNKVPPQLAALVFEVQETLEDLRSAEGAAKEKLAAQVRDELAKLEQQRGALLEQLQGNFARWDADGAEATPLLRELKDILSRRAYLATLIRDVEQGLAR
jgi:molecular chaperone HscB